jgi:hypothetical protein
MAGNPGIGAPRWQIRGHVAFVWFPRGPVPDPPMTISFLPDATNVILVCLFDCVTFVDASFSPLPRRSPLQAV